jgi:hypothetical protein
LPGRRLQSNLPRGGHLNRQGYIAHGEQILDASIVPVPRNHNTRDENAAIKKGEVPEGWTDKPAKRMQKDVDARWTKKHGKSHYGYKNHVDVGPVALSCRAKCSFKPPFVQKRPGFSSPMLSGGGADYRSR